MVFLPLGHAVWPESVTETHEQRFNILFIFRSQEDRKFFFFLCVIHTSILSSFDPNRRVSEPFVNASCLLYLILHTRPVLLDFTYRTASVLKTDAVLVRKRSYTLASRRYLRETMPLGKSYNMVDWSRTARPHIVRAGTYVAQSNFLHGYACVYCPIYRPIILKREFRTYCWSFANGRVCSRLIRHAVQYLSVFTYTSLIAELLGCLQNRAFFIKKRSILFGRLIPWIITIDTMKMIFFSFFF